MFQAQSVASFRAQFPQLAASVGGYPLIYLDNAATTQKPLCVIESQAHFYMHGNANIHRGVHTLSQEATLQYEQARRRVQSFVGAQHSHEIVFTSGATQAINMIASGFAQRLQPGDEILVSSMEHHSNIVPWQMACERSGSQLRVIPMTETGELSLPEYEKCLGERTRLVAVTHVSNALGTINPIREMVGSAKRFGIPVLVDGAQAVSHMPVDVQTLGCDFYVFSGHKMFAPTGIGILYGREAWLDRLPPHMGGGDMIKTVTFEHTEYNDLPYKFEAGTPNIAGAIGLGVAVDFLQKTGFEWIHHQETELLLCFFFAKT